MEQHFVHTINGPTMVLCHIIDEVQKNVFELCFVIQSMGDMTFG